MAILMCLQSGTNMAITFLGVQSGVRGIVVISATGGGRPGQLPRPMSAPVPARARR